MYYVPFHVINTGEYIYIYVRYVHWNRNGRSKISDVSNNTVPSQTTAAPRGLHVEFSAVIRHLPGTETESVNSRDNNIVKVQGVLFIS